MHVTIICVPYQIDVSRWGCALGPPAFLDHGLIQRLEARGHDELCFSNEADLLFILTELHDRIIDNRFWTIFLFFASSF